MTTSRTLGLVLGLSVVVLGAPGRCSAQVLFGPIAITGGYNQDMVVDNPATSAVPYGGQVSATMDAGTAKTGNTWYEVGTDTLFPNSGLPMGQTVTAASSNAQRIDRFTLAGATTNNAILLDTASSTARVTFATAQRYTALSFLTSSGNGGGTPPTIQVTLNFSDGTAPLVGGTFRSPDWFNVGDPRGITSQGRIDFVNNTFNNEGADNPRLYVESVFLPASAPLHPVSSIDLSWTVGNNANAHTAIFAIAGTIPEPSSLALVGLGGLGLLARRRLRKKA